MTHMSELLTVKEVAQFLKTSRIQVRKMIQSGILPAVKIGREYRISSECLKKFLELNMSGMNNFENF